MVGIANFLLLYSRLLYRKACRTALAATVGRRDQEVRERIVPLLATVDFDQLPSEEWIALVDEQNAVDEANIRRLEEIVGEFGWPGRALVGEEASQAAEVILNHAELAEQIRVEQGRDQIYGTEFVNGPDGALVLHPIESPETVDERRASVGLPPLEEYLRQVEEALGRPVQF